MQRNLIRLLAAACAVAGLSTAAAQEIDSVVKKLQATNSITLGYRETLLPTSYLDDQKKPTGYAIEMCMRILDEVKAELKLPQIKVDYVPVNIQNRQALVANGTVQLECGGTVNTFARNKQVDFSPVSYVAASQLLVLKSSHIAKFEDLNGKIVAVATGGSSEPELKHIIETNKLNVRVLNVDDHAAGLIAVESRRADAYFNDNAAFFSLIKQSKNARQPRRRRARVRLFAARLHGAQEQSDVPLDRPPRDGQDVQVGRGREDLRQVVRPVRREGLAEAARGLGDRVVSRVTPGP